MRPIVFNVKSDLNSHTATGRIADGSPRGKRVKVWLRRNIAGDYYVARMRLGWGILDRTGSYHGPWLRVVSAELVREYAVAKHVGKR